MAPEVVVKIVDELIPRSERGILLNNIIADMGGVEERVFQYQNVTIRRCSNRMSGVNLYDPLRQANGVRNERPGPWTEVRGD